VKRSCVTCGQPTSTGRHCPRHQPPLIPDATSWNQQRSKRNQYAFRLAVLYRDQYRCRCRGQRDGCDRPHADPCGAVRDLHAHHTQPGNDDPSTGLTLCRACHRAVDSKAR
jgi:predicted restriction endonuclease